MESEKATIEQVHRPHYAGFWLRAVADCVDSILLDLVAALIGLMLLGIVYWVGSTPFWEMFSDFVLQMIFFSLRGALSIYYYTLGHYRYGMTIGKKCFGIQVVSVDPNRLDRKITLTESWLRTCGYLLSYLPMGAGFLMAAFQPQKRALHDLIAGTMCIVRSR